MLHGTRMLAFIHLRHTHHTATPPPPTTIFLKKHLTEGSIYFGSWFGFSLWSAGSTVPWQAETSWWKGRAEGAAHFMTDIRKERGEITSSHGLLASLASVPPGPSPPPVAVPSGTPSQSQQGQA